MQGNDEYKCRSAENANRLEGKIDSIVDQMGDIKITLAKQHESLKTHIKRTDLLEEKVAPLAESHIKSLGRLEILGWVGGLLAAAAALAEIIRYIKDV